MNNRHLFEFHWISLQRPKSWIASFVVLDVLSLTMIFVFMAVGRIRTLHDTGLADSLKTILRITQGSVHLWKADTEADISGMAGLPRVRALTLELAQGGGSKKNLDREFTAVLESAIKAHGYLGFTAFSRGRNGMIRTIASSPGFRKIFAGWNDTAELALSGKFALGRPIILNQDQGLATAGNKVWMIAAYPITGANGQPIAAIAFWLDAFGTFTQATQLGQLGESGETYGVDQLGNMISRSRFGSQLQFLREPGKFSLTRMARSLTKRESGLDLAGYRDYRGVMTVGAWAWDSDLGIGFATEMNREEAYRSFVIARRVIWALFGISLLAALIVYGLREARARMERKNKSLEKTVEAQHEILGTVSHDLKNPLNALLLTNEILLRTLPQNLEFTDRRRKLLERSRHAALRMKELITDLLDTANIEAGMMHIHPEEVKCGVVLSRIVELIGPLAAEKSIRFEQDIEENIPDLLVDQSRTIQVLSNLLGNSIKFTGSGGKIVLRARLKDGWIEFLVKDNGPGVSTEHLPHLFERYWQAEKTAKFGSGLGLAICREIVIAHGGKIWAESVLGQGAAFYFTLPSIKCADAPLVRARKSGAVKRDQEAIVI